MILNQADQAITFGVSLMLSIITYFTIKYMRGRKKIQESKKVDIQDTLKTIRKDLNSIRKDLNELRDQVTP